ncbi:MAG TPA: flagellar hook-basal body complex protein FliE [Lachnospiraceae bacterium]|nr:flagellar hook-basal body complex protein FliE [Lachnospiraceae bacterium]
MDEMFITPIEPMSLSGLSGTAQKVKGQDGISLFQGIFQEAIDNVRVSDDVKNKEQYLLATGQAEDPHSYPIAAAKAQLSVDLLVALRSKALDSYTEIMRISA